MCSCQIISEDDFSFEELAASPIKMSQKEVTKLPRGGYIINTHAGNIQFGMPPETIKDALSLGIMVPTYYIVPSNRFDKIFAVSVAEFEFPAYFNFFVKKSRINLICTQEGEQAIRKIFQETLLGPEDFSTFTDDFDDDYPKQAIPMIAKELAHFAKDPFNVQEPLTVDSLIQFVIFDGDGIATLPKNVRVRQDLKRFVILEGEEEVATFKDYVKIKIKEHQDYSTQRYGLFKGVNVDHAPKQVNVYQESFKPVFFQPPVFGVTVLGGSHGFDPKGSTSGYIFWINSRGIMVDPPIFATHELKKSGVPSNLIDWVIITHVHADHDAGIMQKILDSSKVELITTKTIMNSFLRKYSAITGMPEVELKALFTFRPVIIGTKLRLNGGVFDFFYSLHTIPCLGFSVSFENKSIHFSGDTFYSPQALNKMVLDGVLTKERSDRLCSNKWNHDLILHEAGVPPIHTPIQVLNDLPPQVKERLFLVHCAEKDVPKSSMLKQALTGLQNTLVLNLQQSATMELFRKLDILSSVELFEKTNIKNVRDLLDASMEKQYKENEPICKEGQVGCEWFIIMKGVVKIYSDTVGRVFERYLQVGDYFGENALFKNEERKATAVAVTPVTLLAIKRTDFQFIFGDDSAVIRNIAVLIESRRSKALSTLCKNAYFSSLNSAQKIQLEAILKEKKLAKNEVLWKKGDEKPFALLIASGELCFFDCPEQKTSFDVGSFIGDINGLLSNRPCDTNLKANKDSLVFVINRKNFVEFLHNNPGLKVLLNKVKYIL